MAKLITLENLQQFLTKGDGHWLVRGDYDGTTGVGYAELANNLVATKGLTVNDDPMSYGIVGGAQKSAVGDGNASLNKLVCVDVVRNQLAPAISTVSWAKSEASAELSINSGVASFTVTGQGQNIYFSANRTNGHKYLIKADIKTTTATTLVGIGTNGAMVSGTNTVASTNWQTVWKLYEPSSTGSFFLGVIDTRASDWDEVQFKNFCYIDLTQRYGNNDVVNAILGTGTDAEKVARLLAFDPEILSDTDFDAGTMVPSKTAKLLSVGVNQWDEETEAGYINDENGAFIPATGDYATTLRSVNFFPCFPNVAYYGYQPAEKASQRIYWYDANKNYLYSDYIKNTTVTSPANAAFFKWALYGYLNTYPVYSNNICINISDPNINGKYYPYKATHVTLPNYEGHGILKVVTDSQTGITKVVADGTELYPDGNSKKRAKVIPNLGALTWQDVPAYPGVFYNNGNLGAFRGQGISMLCPAYQTVPNVNSAGAANANPDRSICGYSDQDAYRLYVHDSRYTSVADFTAAMASVPLVILTDTEEDITTPVFQSTFPVEQGGTLQFLDENDNPIAGLQGSEIFYQKNIKAFVEALGEATDWDPERIKRLGNLSFTPEYVNIPLNPSPTGAYARAQVYNATFTIVISAALTGANNGSITFQDSEVDLTNFQTKPAEAIYDMDGKKVSEAPVTADCNIASFVGRSKSGIVLWSLLHSGVNKVKIHIEEAVPLDSSGNGKIDCRASLIL